MMNLTKISKEAIAIAKDAASFIKSERSFFRQSDIEVKGLNDLVSYVDRTSEYMIVNGLKSLIPSAGFIVEEKTIAQQKSEFQWVIDPLDGTTNFIHGLMPYAVSIGLLYKDEPVLGVICEVGNMECFSAIKGKGAFLNKEPIQVSAIKNISESLIITGFPVNEFSKNEVSYKLMDYFIKNTHGIRRLGSAAADLAYIACGRSEAFYEYDLKPWDVAAGAIIVKEAGGMVSDFKAKDNFIFGKEIVATNFNIYDEFIEIISKLIS
ncbi:MAG: inositol monophosphatase [Bacteroidales bacterium]|nr:inositol monophosphatase [Bacteroidales bacterium]